MGKKEGRRLMEKGSWKKEREEIDKEKELGKEEIKRWIERVGKEEREATESSLTKLQGNSRRMSASNSPSIN